MARGRMLNISVASDLRLNEQLSLEAHWAYMMAIPHLDRDGIMSGHPKVVAGRICPLRSEIGDRMAAIIEEWIGAGLVIRYETGNGPALYFTGFKKNQSLGASYAKEGKSVFPPPPGFVRTSTGLIHADSVEVPTNSGVTPNEVPTNSGDSLRERKEEVKEKEKAAAVRARVSEASPPNISAAAADSDLVHLFQKWDANEMGKRTEAIDKQMADLLAKYQPTDIEGAIDIACKRNKRTLGYVAGILEKGVRSPPPHVNGAGPPPTEAEKSKLITRASNARSNLRTAEQFGGVIDPQWQRDIDRAKEAGLI